MKKIVKDLLKKYTMDLMKKTKKIKKIKIKMKM